MNEQRDYTIYAQPGGAATVRNKVLRQTYSLLALSLIPTVIGAWVGVAVILAIAFLSINLIVDILYVYLDPRVQRS